AAQESKNRLRRGDQGRQSRPQTDRPLALQKAPARSFRAATRAPCVWAGPTHTHSVCRAAAVALRAHRGARPLDVHITLTEDDRAGAVAGFAHARAQLRQFCVRIHHVTLDGLASGLIVPTVIDCYPTTFEFVRPTELRPGHPCRHAWGSYFH